MISLVLGTEKMGRTYDFVTRREVEFTHQV
jgi:hypothetical protein